MLADAVKRAIWRAGRTGPGQNAIHAAVLRDPRLARFDTVRDWPESLVGFEDLAFLFSSNQLNHGIISQQIDEAALLYRLVRGLGGATIAEIGRFKGGSTLLIAAAMHPQAELYSYDIHVPLEASFTGADLDRSLAGALRRYGLEERVHLVVADSRTVEPPPGHCDLVLVDGDHSYEGVRADWEHWRGFVAPGGHVLFHDAVDHGGYGAFCPGVVQLVAEIGRTDGEFERLPGAGSIARFARRQAAASA